MADGERRFDVDGETFRVLLHDDGGFDCEWLTGPNPGYGFASGAPAAYTMRSAGASADVPQGRAGDDRVVESIRRFLAMIDPETGFIVD